MSYLDTLTKKQLARLCTRIDWRICTAMEVSSYDYPTAVYCGHKHLVDVRRKAFKMIFPSLSAYPGERQ